MKGINFMIEIAISILIISLALLFLFKGYEKLDFSKKYKYIVYKELVSMDKEKRLRYYALNNDYLSINQSLSSSVKGRFNYFVTIFNKTSNVTVLPNINYQVSVVDYIISGDFGNYSPRKIKVFIWD